MPRHSTLQTPGTRSSFGKTVGMAYANARTTIQMVCCKFRWCFGGRLGVFWGPVGLGTWVAMWWETWIGDLEGWRGIKDEGVGLDFLSSQQHPSFPYRHPSSLSLSIPPSVPSLLLDPLPRRWSLPSPSSRLASQASVTRQLASHRLACLPNNDVY